MNEKLKNKSISLRKLGAQAAAYSPYTEYRLQDRLHSIDFSKMTFRRLSAS